METTPFTPVNLHIFSVNDAHAIVTSTLSYAETAKTEFDALTVASYTDLKSNNTAMGQRMNLASGDPATAAIDTEDLQRDGWWSEMKRDVKTACSSLDKDRKEAGLALKVFFTPYWNLQKAPLPTETDLIEELDGKLQDNPTLLAHMSTLGLTPKFENMKASNVRLKALYNNRTSEQAANAGTAASILKAKVANSFTQFCYLIELANVLIPSDSIKTLFNHIEQVRKKYAVLYKASSNDEDDATDTGTDTTPA